MIHGDLWLTLGDAGERPSFRLDPLNLSFWRMDDINGDQRIPLMPRTFDVLHYLARHPGRLVGHDELLEGIWGDEAVQPEVLKTHIHAIRQAVGDIGATKRFIGTERGRGYRLIARLSRGVANRATTDADSTRALLPGRASMLSALRSALGEATSGRPQLVLVSGAAGMGKTALIEAHLAEQATGGPSLTALGRCIEGFAGREPFYPLLEALDSLCRGQNGPEIAKSVAALAPTWAMQLTDAVPPEQLTELRQAGLGKPEGMIREAHQLFRALSRAQVITIVLEDLHWSDFATLDTLSALFGNSPTGRLLVIATYRTPELLDEAEPLQRMARELAIKDSCTEICLPPLTETEVGDVVAPAGPVDAPFVRLLASWSGGNPLFLRMTLQHLLVQGHASQTDAGWIREAEWPDLVVGAPPPLAHFVRARVATMPEPARRVIEAASAFGSRFTPTLLASAIGLDALECERICRALLATVFRDDATAAGSAGLSTFSFQHILFRHALYEGLGVLHRKDLHLRLAETMEQAWLVDRRSVAVLSISRHFELAEDWTRALRYAEAAIVLCDRRHARQDALAIVGSALRLTEELPPAARSCHAIRLLERRASIQAASHNSDADASFGTLLALGEREGNVGAQVRALLGLAYTRSWHDAEASERHIDAALRLSADLDDPATQGLTRIAAYTRRIWTSGWNKNAAAASQSALASVQHHGSALALAEALMMFSMLCVVSGSYTAACTFITGAYRRITASSNEGAKPDLVRAAWMYHAGLPWALLYKGDLDGSAAAYARSLNLFQKRADATAFRSLTIYQSVLAFHCLAFDHVIEKNAPILESVLTNDDGDNGDGALPFEIRIALIYSGLAHAGRGEHGLAASYFDAAEAEMTKHTGHLDWYWRLQLEWGSVGHDIRNDPVCARRRAERLVELARDTEEWTWRALAHEALARAALAQDDIHAAEEAIAEALSICSTREASMARWRVLRTFAEVAEAQGDALTATEYHQASAIDKQRHRDVGCRRFGVG